jgi:hypothetical protein
MSPFLNGPLDLPPLPLLRTREVSPLPDAPLPPPEIPFVLDDVGTFLDLPPIGGAIEVNLPRIADANNPGTSKPQEQGFRFPTVDQTRSVTASTVPWMNSDGQFQTPDPGAGQKGITVTREVVPIHNHDGSFQPLNLATDDQGMSTDQRPGGLPMESRPDNQNLTKLSRTWAEPLPVAKNVNADARKHGGLPVAHIIK